MNDVDPAKNEVTMHPAPQPATPSGGEAQYSSLNPSNRAPAREPEPPAAAPQGLPRPMRWLLAAIDQIPIGVAMTRPDGILEYVNPRLSAVTGLSLQEALGLGIDAIRSANDGARLDQLRPFLLARGRWEGEVRYRDRTAGFLPALETVCAVWEPGGPVAGFVHFVQDMTSQRLVESLRRLAFYDGLTGLPNRALVEDRLSLAIAHGERYHSSFAVLCIDMDQFKQVNDTLGHAVGDRLLAAVAHRLQAGLRVGDTLGRWGGDEFVALVEGIQQAGALRAIAERLVATGARPYAIGDLELPMTVSIGVSLYPQHGRDSRALLAAADAAMYQAKAAGGGTWRVPLPG
jgi:diguanylate cyclase (GGDEF)-like protein/PAS domain S-box-containing protein